MIGAHRYHYGDEYQLQDGIEKALVDDGWGVCREVLVYGRRDRIDFLVSRDGRTWFGVEVKVAGNRAAVERQLKRYLESALSGIVLVTTRVRHQMPSSLCGKPIEVVCLAGNAL